MKQTHVNPSKVLVRAGKLAMLASAVLILTAAHPAEHQSPAEPLSTEQKSTAVDTSPASTVIAFHSALERGDTKMVLELLTEDASIFESGNAERSRAEYAAHHLQSDIAFSGSVKRTLVDRSVVTNGDTAWLMSIDTVSGTFRGRPVNSRSAETMILIREEEQWRISHIHWSSAKLEKD